YIVTLVLTLFFFFFFFQAEDGIRDFHVTGVQTCALPISLLQIPIFYALFRFFPNVIDLRGKSFLWADDLTAFDSPILIPEWIPRSEEHTSELQSRENIVCRLLLEKIKQNIYIYIILLTL